MSVAAAAALWAAIVATRTHRATSERSTDESGEWRRRVDADIANFKTFMLEVREEIRGIRDKIEQILVLQRPSKTVKSGSPLQLTKLDQKVSDEIRARAWARRVAPELDAKVADRDAYEIQEFCFLHSSRVDVGPEMSHSIRNSADSHGIDETDVRRVLGIELRDTLLAKLGLLPADEPTATAQ